MYKHFCIALTLFENILTKRIKDDTGLRSKIPLQRLVWTPGLHKKTSPQGSHWGPGARDTNVCARDVFPQPSNENTPYILYERHPKAALPEGSIVVGCQISPWKICRETEAFSERQNHEISGSAASSQASKTLDINASAATGLVSAKQVVNDDIARRPTVSCPFRR